MIYKGLEKDIKTYSLLLLLILFFASCTDKQRQFGKEVVSPDKKYSARIYSIGPRGLLPAEGYAVYLEIRNTNNRIAECVVYLIDDVDLLGDIPGRLGEITWVNGHFVIMSRKPEALFRVPTHDINYELYIQRIRQYSLETGNIPFEKGPLSILYDHDVEMNRLMKPYIQNQLSLKDDYYNDIFIGGVKDKLFRIYSAGSDRTLGTMDDLEYYFSLKVLIESTNGKEEK